jgi:hypothetical protein
VASAAGSADHCAGARNQILGSTGCNGRSIYRQ